MLAEVLMGFGGAVTALVIISPIPKKLGNLNPVKALPFYKKPPALVDPVEILIGMVCTEILRPDITLLQSGFDKFPYGLRTSDHKIRTDKFAVGWNRYSGNISRASIHLNVMGESVTLDNNRRQKLAETLETLTTFEVKKAELAMKEEAQKKACDLLEKWMGLPNPASSEPESEK